MSDPDFKELNHPGGNAARDRAEAAKLEHSSAARDAKDFRRATVSNLLGYVVKGLHPLLLVVVVRAYGAEPYGIFAVTQAVLLFVMRLCLVGLDKAMLWWLSQPEYMARGRGFVSSLAFAGAASLGASLLITAMGAEALARLGGTPNAASTYRTMALALFPLTMTEMLVFSLTAYRRVETQVFVKEGLVPISQALAAVAFAWAGLMDSGLPLSVVISAWLGFAATLLWGWRTLFRQRHLRLELRPPGRLIRYALPLWLSELANMLFLRLDLYLLPRLAGVRAAGIYAAAAQVAKVIRSVRESLGPVAMPMVSECHALRDTPRMVSAFSRSASTVLLIQAPMFAAIFGFSDWIMRLLGGGFETGASALAVLAAAWMLNGVLGLYSMALCGLGRSDLHLVDTVLTIAVQAVFLWLLTPSMGMVGAASAVLLSVLFQGLLQLLQTRQLTGLTLLSRETAWMLLLAGLASGAMIGVHLASGANGIQGAFGVLAFFLVSGIGMSPLVRRAVAAR